MHQFFSYWQTAKEKKIWFYFQKEIFHLFLTNALCAKHHLFTLSQGFFFFFLSPLSLFFLSALLQRTLVKKKKKQAPDTLCLWVATVFRMLGVKGSRMCDRRFHSSPWTAPVQQGTSGVAGAFTARSIDPSVHLQTRAYQIISFTRFLRQSLLH